VVVEYREKNNTPNLLVSADSDICEKIYEGTLDPLILAKKMKITDLRTGKIIPPKKDDK